MVDCDRVFVLLHQTGRYRAVACSGIDWIDRHAPLAADLEKLVTAVAPLKRAWSTDGDLRSVEPEIHRHLEPYLDQSTVRHLALVPMMPAGDLCDGNSELPIGIFAFENLVDRPVVHDTALISAVAHHAEAALVEMSQRETLLVRAAIGLTSPWRVWFRTRRVSKWLLAIMVGVAVVGGAMMWPVTFQVRAEGELVPDSRKYVFASHNGFLDEIFVSHGDKVIAGQPVARISSPELELEARRLLGELQTTQEQLAATTAERFQVTGVDQRSVQRAGELTAQEGSLKEQELSLTEQLAIVKRQEDQLLLRSDISGVVVDWNLQQRLVRRPVQRGQVVLQIADLSGPWSLELRVPDESAGHVLKATESSAEPLAVTFVVNQDPEVTHVGTLRDRSTTTENPQDGSAYVEMQVAFPQDRVMTRRTDAQVTAKIHCGRRRLGFVLFHEVVEELRRTFF
jgi:multidrug efflux pump subunit AcrA (membrane-fusion protein)